LSVNRLPPRNLFEIRPPQVEPFLVVAVFSRGSPSPPRREVFSPSPLLFEHPYQSSFRFAFFPKPFASLLFPVASICAFRFIGDPSSPRVLASFSVAPVVGNLLTPLYFRGLGFFFLLHRTSFLNRHDFLCPISNKIIGFSLFEYSLDFWLCIVPINLFPVCALHQWKGIYCALVSLRLSSLFSNYLSPFSVFLFSIWICSRI